MIEKNIKLAKDINQEKLSILNDNNIIENNIFLFYSYFEIELILK